MNVERVYTEHMYTFCSQFGGNDLLQIYNAQQIKHRLNTIGMYVASTKVCEKSFIPYVNQWNALK